MYRCRSVLVGISIRNLSGTTPCWADITKSLRLTYREGWATTASYCWRRLLISSQMSRHLSHTSSTGLQTRPTDPGIRRLPSLARAPGFSHMMTFHHCVTRASHYGDAMRELDDAIGQILERVRQQKSSSRATLVLFTSDNGADLNARERAGGCGMMRKHNIGFFFRLKWTPTLWQADNL